MKSLSEMIILFITAVVMPVIIKKTIEAKRFDWIEQYLQPIWAVIITVCSLYLLLRPDVLEVVMKWHDKWGETPLVYLFVGIIGALILCGYWWFTGKMFHEKINQIPAQKMLSTDKSIPKKATDNSIPEKLVDKVTPTTHTTIIMQAPSVGNLKQRAITLSNEILEELYRSGLFPRSMTKELIASIPIQTIRKIPTGEEDRISWVNSRSSYFKHFYLERVRDIKDEFTQLHIRDQELDEIIKRADLVNNRPSTFLPQEIERVADRLKILAEQVPSK